MILKRFYDEKLAQASFLVGCAKAGEAAVIDANRAVDTYIEAAAAEGLRIGAVTETHIHADYISGSRELAERTGAQMYLSDEGDADWKYAFANQPNVSLIKDGSSIQVGNIRLDVLKTPGHTPEHITFVLTDEPASPLPLGAFTGDFIFVGDVGRPDLLERAAGFEGTMELGAKRLYGSLERFLNAYSDALQIWPGHGAGSACGKSLGGVPISTLGYEKTANWGLKLSNEEVFVQEVLAGQPEPPVYFKEMKRINKMGPPLLNGFKVPGRLGGAMLFALMEKDAVLVDIRSTGETAAGFIPGLLNIPSGKSFTTWAGWLISYEKPIYLLANNELQVAEAVRDLQSIGLDDVRGWVGADALQAYEQQHGTLETIPQITALDMFAQLQSGKVRVLDVRGLTEFEAGHVPGAMHIPLGHLEKRRNEIPTDRPLVLQCQGGARSPIAVSLLRKLGYQNLLNLSGGFAECCGVSLPVETASMASVS